MSNDSTKKTLTVALGVCFVCSILVSAAAVGLKKIQKENLENERIRNILIAGNLWQDGIELRATYDRLIRGKMIDLASGETISDPAGSLNPETFDVKTMARDGKFNEAIPAERDLADILFRPKEMAVYHVVEGDTLKNVILPVYGKGLWSTMYGFIALDSDLRTIRGFTFYEHGETPGLGGEVDNPAWKNSWVGKEAFDTTGKLILEVIKGKVDPLSSSAKNQIDGLSGSTLTTRGIDNLVRYWLGEYGYGPYLKKLRNKGSQNG